MTPGTRLPEAGLRTAINGECGWPPGTTATPMNEGVAEQLPGIPGRMPRRRMRWRARRGGRPFFDSRTRDGGYGRVFSRTSERPIHATASTGDYGL